MKATPIAILLLLISTTLSAETVIEAWVNRYSHTTDDSFDSGNAIATDGNGNVIVAGTTDDRIVGTDFLVVKYSAAGIPLWTNRYNTPANDGASARDVAVDNDGNIFVAGFSDGSHGLGDCVTIKYSSQGAGLWTNRFNGPDNSIDYPNRIAVDASGDLIVAGITGTDFLTIKYSSAGLPLWTNYFDGPGSLSYESIRAMAVGLNGNVIVSGYSDDPKNLVTISYSSNGAALWTNLYNVSRVSNVEICTDSAGNVLVAGAVFGVIKFSPAGTVLWTKAFNALGGEPYSIATDPADNVFVTGISAENLTTWYDYLTVKYSGNGVALWTNRYTTPGLGEDVATKVAVGSAGNVFVTGYDYLSTGGRGFATVVYSNAGTPLWTNRFNRSTNNSEMPSDLVLDENDNVFVTGISYGNGFYISADCTTIGYSAMGQGLWTNHYNGQSNSEDIGQAVAVDNSGNTFVTGYSDAGSINYDFATIAYSQSGSGMWTNRYNGPGNGDDRANAIAVDSAGNVIVTGYSTASGINQDYTTIKYSSNGTGLWTNRYGTASTDYASAMALDSNDNVFVTGNSGNNYATIKYSAVGIPMWTNYFTVLASTDEATAIAVSSNGTVFVTGYSGSPPPNTNSVGSTNFVTIAYSNAGQPLWTNRYSGPSNRIDQATALVVGGNGNVYVTGLSYGAGNYDYATIAYSSAGSALWTNRYNGPGNSADKASAISVDNLGNVFVTGDSVGNGTGTDYATIKYSSSGVPLWTNRYHSAGDYAVGIAADSDRNVFVSGYDGADFVTIKYSTSGSSLWTNRYSGLAGGEDRPFTKSSIKIGPDGAAYVTGRSDGDFDPNFTTSDYVTIKYVAPPEIMIHPNSQTNNIGVSVAFQVLVTGSASLQYQWRRNGTNLFNAGSISGANSNLMVLTNAQTADAGGYDVVVTNAFGSVTSSLAMLTVVVPSPITMISANYAGGTFRSSFTNTPGASFTVVATTNVLLPLSNWTTLSGVTEIFSGQFQFADTQATNYSQRFYRVHAN